jgi:hypothetical protein
MQKLIPENNLGSSETQFKIPRLLKKSDVDFLESRVIH